MLIVEAKSHVDTPPQGMENPVAYQSGDATIRLSYSDKAAKHVVEIEKIGLSSHGSYGHGEWFEVDATGKIATANPKTLKSTNEDELKPKSIAAHRPAGTVASFGVIDIGERAWFAYSVYHVVRVGERSYEVVCQRWNSNFDVPQQEDTRVVERLQL